MLAMVGLYLYDSTTLLAADEALITSPGNGRWCALFGVEGFQIRGKELFVPNPLLPHRPLYRFFWSMEGLVGPSQPWVPPSGEGYAGLAPLIWLMVLALFALFPLGLFSRLGDAALVAGLLLFYLSALSALVQVWLRRDEYGINGRQFASLAFESISCPPYALNLVRHLSLRLKWKEDLLCVVDRYLSGAERSAALKQVITRVKNEIDWEDETTLRAQALCAHLHYLAGEVSS